AEDERLRRLMEVKNIFPRLKCRVGANTFTYQIDKPQTRIGREQDNDLILSNEKVSRHHAEIIFNGSGFEIIDKRSTNKVIVNGQFVERATLKSGDIIGLGKVVITFYI
ncbi:MAG: FHA domain-containing protein, partial [Lentimicrobiaceae bacterium]|nr:FHA domain-containing protein [Lentimicrobiaceae bacterium]